MNDLLKGYTINSANIFVIMKSPSKSIYSRYQILQIANNINPDLVFTMAGPAYVNFKSLHLMGCSNPYVLFASAKDIFFGRNFIEFLIRYAHTRYQLYYIKKATHYLFQSNSSRDELSNKISVKNSFVIPNAVGIIDRDILFSPLQEKKYFQSDKYKILCPFAKYPHKGFHILPKLIKLLDSNNINAHFVVTIDLGDIPTNSRIANINQNSHISYIGEQQYNHMINLYEECDIVFMPSVLEVFSSVCIEALYYKKPLVIAEKSFNSDIVGDYAFYCNPYSIESCLDAIIRAKSYIKDEKYLKEGKEQVVNKFGMYSQRHKSIIKSINNIIK